MTTSFHTRWVFSQVNGFADIAIKGNAAGLVIVYDLSPGAAFGLVQRSVYTPDGKAGLGAKYINCPTLTLDRVNGAKVLADAKAARSADADSDGAVRARHRDNPISPFCRARITAPRRISRSCSPPIPTPCR